MSNLHLLRPPYHRLIFFVPCSGGVGGSGPFLAFTSCAEPLLPACCLPLLPALCRFARLWLKLRDWVALFGRCFAVMALGDSHISDTLHWRSPTQLFMAGFSIKKINMSNIRLHRGVEMFRTCSFSRSCRHSGRAPAWISGTPGDTRGWSCGQTPWRSQHLLGMRPWGPT